MDNDLISRETALSIVERNAFHEGREWVFRGRIMRELEEATAVNAEPVRHGRWILGEPNMHGNRRPKCSVCGEYHLHAWADHARCNFCPNCGAKMDGDSP